MPATVAEGGTSKVIGPEPNFYIGKSMQDFSKKIVGTSTLDATETSFTKTEAFKFKSGDSLFIEADSSNGVALSNMQLIICHSVGEACTSDCPGSDCKLRDITLGGEKSFWIDEEETTSSVSCNSAASNICGLMGSSSFKFRNCVDEGKIELSFDGESFGELALEVTKPDC